MTRWDWLRILLGLLSGVTLGQWLASSPRSRASRRREASARIDKKRLLTREDVLHMIEQNRQEHKSAL